MKKSYKLLVLGVAMLCFGLGNLQAQNNNYASLSYFNKAQLLLKDGTLLKGQAKLKNAGWVNSLSEEIVFKPSYNNKAKTTYNASQVKEVVFYDEQGRSKTYIYYLLKKNKYILLEPLVLGKVSFLVYQRTQVTGAQQTNRHTQTQYYLARHREEPVLEIRYGSKFKKFQKIAAAYFSTCPDLINKIEEQYFNGTILGVQDMCLYYNTQCK